MRISDWSSDVCSSDLLRLRDADDGAGAAGRDAGLARDHRAVRPRLPRGRTLRIHPPDRRGRGAVDQRLPVGLLHAGRHPRAARHLRHRLARHADDPGRAKGVDPRQPPPADVPQHVLALHRRRLDRRLHLRLSDGSAVMSTDTVRAHDHHAEGAHDEPAHGTIKGYLTGFGLSVVLTVIPFWIVMSGAIAARTAAFLVFLAFAFVQIVVHMISFLPITTP